MEDIIGLVSSYLFNGITQLLPIIYLTKLINKLIDDKLVHKLF